MKLIWLVGESKYKRIQRFLPRFFGTEVPKHPDTQSHLAGRNLLENEHEIQPVMELIIHELIVEGVQVNYFIRVAIFGRLRRK